MSLSQTIRGSFDRSFGLYRDLLAECDAPTLNAALPGVRSNTVGQQLWCVVGARESYARAIEAGAWAGFSCSLDEPADPGGVGEALARSERAVAAVLEGIEGFTDPQHRLLLDLLEHEAAHHGQLIRYLYGLGLRRPESWKQRYALD